MDSNVSSTQPRRGWPVRFFRALFSWRTLRRLLIVLAPLVTIVAIVVTEENWRGKRAWENYKREQEAKGEHFEYTAFVPPPVPDDQNLAMCPLLKPMADYEFVTNRLPEYDNLPFRTVVSR